MKNSLFFLSLLLILFSFKRLNSNINSNEFLIIYGTLKFDSAFNSVPPGILLLEDIDTKENKCSKKQHALNRRTEFRLVSGEYKPENSF